ncbi:unnamed protein product [Amoebophrya sp. A25]|nr:unnamed protein product [Amoebophrya sp. A25]|eukprot:GSA25T00017587001.1
MATAKSMFTVVSAPSEDILKGLRSWVDEDPKRKDSTTANAACTASATAPSSTSSSASSYFVAIQRPDLAAVEDYLQNTAGIPRPGKYDPELILKPGGHSGTVSLLTAEEATEFPHLADANYRQRTNKTTEGASPGPRASSCVFQANAWGKKIHKNRTYQQEEQEPTENLKSAPVMTKVIINDENTSALARSSVEGGGSLFAEIAIPLCEIGDEGQDVPALGGGGNSRHKQQHDRFRVSSSIRPFSATHRRGAGSGDTIQGQELGVSSTSSSRPVRRPASASHGARASAVANTPKQFTVTRDFKNVEDMKRQADELRKQAQDTVERLQNGRVEDGCARLKRLNNIYGRRGKSSRPTTPVVSSSSGDINKSAASVDAGLQPAVARSPGAEGSGSGGRAASPPFGCRRGAGSKESCTTGAGRDHQLISGEQYCARGSRDGEHMAHFFSNLQKELEAKVEKLEGENRKLKSRVGAMQSERVALQSAAQTSSRTMQMMQDRLHEGERKLVTERKKSEAMDRKIRLLENREAGLLTELQTACSEQASDHRDDLTAECDDLRSDRDRLKKTVAILRQELAQKEERIQRLQVAGRLDHGDGTT